MRSKLLLHGKSIFDTYELLEMLLYHTVSYKDTNPTAKELLKKFGGLDGVLSASVEELVTVAGVGERSAELISLCGELDSILGAEIVPDGGVDFTDYRSTGEYITRCFAKYPDATVAVFLFDNGMHPLDFTMVTDAAYGSAAIKPKLLIDLALTNRATVAITASNSRYGAAVSTESERMTTKMIGSVFNSIGIYHMEHYSVSGKRFSSMMGSASAFRTDLPEVVSFVESRDRENESEEANDEKL